MDLHHFKLHRSYLISFNLSNAGEILQKEKQHFCFVLTYSIKRAREIRKFHVAVMQQWLRNVQKSVMHVKRCLLSNLNLLFFCCSTSQLQNISIVVIQKFCYHGNVTSHFSYLFLKPKCRSIVTPP